MSGLPEDPKRNPTSGPDDRTEPGRPADAADGGSDAPISEADQPTRPESAAPTRPLPKPLAASFKPGSIIGDRYEIREFLGRGGMGEVWHAFDLKLRVDVALKALLPEVFQDAKRRDLMRSEVRAAREVVSPNVCRMFDLIEIQGQELVSMEFVDGTTLLDVLQERGPLDLEEASAIASQFLAGLEAIHQAGLVHRDVKPENIMITRAGRVILMDFGLARQQQEGSATVMGTPAYMAPEQLRGDSVDARADVYAAGVVLAEMVSPDGVKKVESRETVWRAVREEPPQLAPTPWAPVLKRAVAKEPQARYPSAHALIRALEEVTQRATGVDDRNPYPGLAFFTERDAEYFFGRELEIETMWRKLQRPHLLALIGPSGAGKSSFLRAGVVPAKPEGWGVVFLTPGGSAFLSLRRALLPELAGDARALEDLLQEEDIAAVISALRRWREHHAEALLIVDQFEELFTLNPPGLAERFTELLGRLAVDTDIHVLLSMRDDFLFNCHDYPALTPIFDALTPLGTLSGTALRRAFVQPAAKCGYRFEDDALIDEMLAEVEGERGALPLMAFAVNRLWERRDPERGLLTRVAYEEIHGVGGALAQHAETVLDRIGRDRYPIVRELFRNLVTGQGTRAVRDREELLSVFDRSDRESADSVLDMLIDARLLTSYEMSGERDEEQVHRRVEIIHESLLSHWPRLVRWQTQDADAAQFRDQVRQAAQVWVERGKPGDLLWTGTSYREFELWLDRYPGGLTESEEAFAHAMSVLAEKQKRRRRVLLTGAFSALAVVLAVVGGLWRQSETARGQAMAETRRAESAKLLALAQASRDENRVTALAYTIASLELADTREARLQALELLWAGPTAFSLPDSIGGWWAVAFSPDGHWLAKGYGDGDVWLWPSDGGPPLQLRADGPEVSWMPSIVFDPSGKYVVTSGSSGTIRFWSLPGGELIRSIPGFTPLTTLYMCDEGRRLVLAAQPWARSARRIAWYSLVPPLGEVTDHGWTAGSRPLPDVEPGGAWVVVPVEEEVWRLPLENIDTAQPEIVARSDTLLAWGGAALDPQGRLLAVADQAGLVSLWSLESRSASPIQARKILGSFGMCFDASGSRLAVPGMADKGGYCTAIWDLAGPPDADALWISPELSQTESASFHPGGKWIAVDQDYLGSQGMLWYLDHPYVRVLRGQPSHAIDVSFTPDGSMLVSCEYYAGAVHLWPLTPESGAGRTTIFRTSWQLPPDAEQKGLLDIAVDPKQRFVIAAGPGVFQIPLDGGDVRTLSGFTLVHAIDIDSGGRYLAGAGGAFSEGEAHIRIWDLESDLTFVLDAGDSVVTDGLAFDPDGGLWATGPFGVRHWNLEKKAFELVGEHPSGAVAVSNDGKRVLVANAREQVFLGNLDSGQWEELPVDGSSVAFAPPGTAVLVGNREGIQVLSLSGGEPHLLPDRERSTLSKANLAVSPDGKWIATGDESGTIRLWPAPDLSKPPMLTLPHDQLLARLKALTNIRMVPDEKSDTGYALDIDPFPGWEESPDR